jgi:hypothetical protein
MKRKVLILIFLLVYLASCTYEKTNDIERSRNNQELAKPIIQAIDQNISDEGKYPTDLENLIPTYLLEMPAMDNGKSFDYFSDTIDGYENCYTLKQ